MTLNMFLVIMIIITGLLLLTFVYYETKFNKAKKEYITARDKIEEMPRSTDAQWDERNKLSNALVYPSDDKSDGFGAVAAFFTVITLVVGFITFCGFLSTNQNRNVCSHYGAESERVVKFVKHDSFVNICLAQTESGEWVDFKNIRLNEEG